MCSYRGTGVLVLAVVIASCGGAESECRSQGAMYEEHVAHPEWARAGGCFEPSDDSGHPCGDGSECRYYCACPEPLPERGGVQGACATFPVASGEGACVVERRRPRLLIAK